MSAVAQAAHPGLSFYFDRHFGRPGVRILAGEFFVTDQDLVLATVLGSCVSACIRDVEAGIGGMNHFMLPDAADQQVQDLPARYGMYAMEVLINEILKRGGRRAALEAKVFGGGAVLRGFSRLNVGDRNAQFVEEYLAAERIPVAASDLRDVYPRKIFYFPKDGQVLVKRLPTQDLRAVSEERAYRARLRQAPAAGEVELFD